MQTQIDDKEIEQALRAWLYTEHGWNLKGEQIKLHYDELGQYVFATVNHETES